jgi:DNA-binding MarR family transcriptional regulator
MPTERSFGLLVSNQTPCGHPISVSHAHAIVVLYEQRRTKAMMSQADLGKVLGIDKSNVARLCSKMEDARHVTQTIRRTRSSKPPSIVTCKPS